MIKIAKRLHPFSHRPKTTCLIPGTEILVEACPARVCVKDLSGKILKEEALDVNGPLKQFTVMQDLERGCVTLFSEQYRFHILPDGEVRPTKNPHLPPLAVREVLSLGSHKKQEWEGIKKRADLREIFPLWLRLGSLLYLPVRPLPDGGMFSLLKACQLAIASHQPETITPAFLKLFLAGFHGLMVPRLIDEEFQGILSDVSVADISPLYLLTEGAALIRSLFFVASGPELTLLPNLPPEFFAGRMLNVSCLGYGELDMEWTKKTLRRLEFRAEREGEIQFRFHSNLRTYRLRRSIREKGEERSCAEPLEIKSGSHYLLDQFQK